MQTAMEVEKTIKIAAIWNLNIMRQSCINMKYLGGDNVLMCKQEAVLVPCRSMLNY